METTPVKGQECYLLSDGETRLAVTKLGAHMAPVAFFADSSSPVEPYYVSPWQGEDLTIDVPVLRPLRGDFFCMPFGANGETSEGYHTTHGEAASAEWRFLESSQRSRVATLRLELPTTARPGRVTAEFSLVPGHACVYTRHTVEGYAGPTPAGHHATLGVQNGPLAVATSPVAFGLTSSCTPPYGADREYYALAPLARFERLDRVPTIWKEPAFTDCSVFPAREGFVDVLQLCQRAGAGPGWATAVCRDGGYLWFALKNLSDFPSTLLWMENRGRHGSPWSGRNVCLGIEDVCGFVAEGLDASTQPNLVNAEGIPTAIPLDGTSRTFPYIQGAVRVGPEFDRVSEVRPTADGVEFVARSGGVARARVATGYLAGQALGE